MANAHTARAVELDPLTDPRWMDLLAGSPDAEPFHHPAWLRLVGGHYGWSVRACAVGGGNGSLGAGLPLVAVSSRLTGRRLVALPFSDSCHALGPVEHHEALGQAMERYRVKTGVPVIVHGPLPGASVVARYHGHRLDIADGSPAASGRYAKSQVMRGVRRAKREGLVVEKRTDRTALDEFFQLHVQTRRRLGVPTQPRRFILGYEALFAQGLGFVVLVRDAGRPVAAALFLTHGDTALYKFGASDASALPKRPNNLLFHEAIKIAREEGRTVLDFGRTDIGHESLRSFKRSFGPDEHELVYTALNLKRATFGGGQLARLAAPVIRRSPLAVGRLAGGLFYRHSA
jgi:CelD/BcsL family acetyltransferase involved in cellulose biosynthesis